MFLYCATVDNNDNANANDNDNNNNNGDGDDDDDDDNDNDDNDASAASAVVASHSSVSDDARRSHAAAWSARSGDAPPTGVAAQAVAAPPTKVFQRPH